MNKNYYDTIERLKPSENAVNRAVNAALEAEYSGKVLKMKHKKTKKKSTIIGALAASLAVVVALGAIFFPSGLKKSENSFFLVASAAEALPDKGAKITDKEFTSLGNSLTFGGGAVTYDEVGGAENGKVVEFTKSFGFNLSCEGNNIETVTYTFDNAKIFLMEDTKLLDYSGKCKHFARGGTYGAHGYSTITMDYGNQISLNEKPEIFTSAITVTPETDDIVNKYYDYDDGKPVLTDKAEIKKIVNNYYDLLFNSFSVTVSVKYKDGAIETKSLIFAVDDPFNETIKAKIA